MPDRPCRSCGAPISPMRQRSPWCPPCAAAERAAHHPTVPTSPRPCARCGCDISHRHHLAQYCGPCAGIRDRERERETAHCRRSMVRPGQAYPECQPPRDLALEARIDAYLAAIRASRRFRLSDEVIWARRVDVLAAEAVGGDHIGVVCRHTAGPRQRAAKAARWLAAQARAVQAPEAV